VDFTVQSIQIAENMRKKDGNGRKKDQLPSAGHAGGSRFKPSIPATRVTPSPEFYFSILAFLINI
jgi:hypothetical protein